jgi:hypothetical protein
MASKTGERLKINRFAFILLSLTVLIIISDNLHSSKALLVKELKDPSEV